MSYAHVLSIEAPRRALEVELAEVRGEYEERTRSDLRRCKRLSALARRWFDERNTSIRDFLRNACPDFEVKEGTYYRHLYSGDALNAGFDGDMNTLEPLGWALRTGGKTPQDVRALIEKEGMEGAVKALRQLRSRTAAEHTTPRRLPDSAAETLDALVERLQDHPDAPVEDTARRGLLMKMLDAAPPPVFEALATMASTGEHTTEALTAALKAYQPDFYEELKRAGCMMPHCATQHGIELHHMARGEQTKRGGDFMIPLCRYHHAPEGKHDSAHSTTREGFYALWGGEAPFLWAVWERYAQAAQAVKRRQA